MTLCREPKDGHSRAGLRKLCGQGRAAGTGKQEVETQEAELTGDSEDCGAEGTQREKEEEYSMTWGFLLQLTHQMVLLFTAGKY